MLQHLPIPSCIPRIIQIFKCGKLLWVTAIAAEIDRGIGQSESAVGGWQAWALARPVSTFWKNFWEIILERTDALTLRHWAVPAAPRPLSHHTAGTKRQQSGG